MTIMIRPETSGSKAKFSALSKDVIIVPYNYGYLFDYVKGVDKISKKSVSIRKRKLAKN